MAKVFQPDANRLEHLGYAAISRVPVLFDNEDRLCREYCRYLRDRAAGRWSPRATAERPVRTRVVSPRTLKQAADSLSVWVDWCHAHKHDWKSANYDDVLKYQNAMLTGSWSLSGRKLSAATANRRADEATAFLEWAAVRQLREPFLVPRGTSKHSFSSGGSSAKTSSQHSSRLDRAKLSRTGGIESISLLPKPQEVSDWLRVVRTKRGLAKYYAAKFILETGTRLEETVSLVAEQIPTMEVLAELRAAGRSAVYVPLTITKGGMPREIPIALEFLLELRRWIDTKRQILAYRFFRRTGQKASAQLFLSDAKGHEGTSISRETLYKVFASVKPRPIKWHPHFGRHAHACFYTLHALQSEATASGFTLRHMGVDWVISRGSWHLKMLQRNLGHADEKTTELYLRWLATAVGLEELYSSWHAFLTGDEG